MSGEIHHTEDQLPEKQTPLTETRDIADDPDKKINYGRWAKNVATLSAVALVGGGFTAAAIKGYQAVTAGAEAVENFGERISDAITPEVDIEMEAEAALSNVTLPNETVVVRGEGSATASTSFDIICPTLQRAGCYFMPGGQDGVLEYVDSTSKLDGFLDKVAKRGAYDLDVELNDQDQPFIVATIDMSQVEARRNEDTIISNSKEHTITDIIDLVNLETSTDGIENANEAFVKSSFKESCEKPLEEALPAGFALTISEQVETTANDLVREKDPITADWLIAMLDQPIELRFDNAQEAENKAVQPFNIESKNVNLVTHTDSSCDLTESFQADIATLEAQSGIEYVVTKPLPSR